MDKFVVGVKVRVTDETSPIYDSVYRIIDVEEDRVKVFSSGEFLYLSKDRIEPLDYTGMPTILVDLDGTLAEYNGYHGPDHIGDPIEEVVSIVRDILDKDEFDVFIFTERANDPEAIPHVKKWCEAHFGRELPITARKDRRTVLIIDDRSMRVSQDNGICPFCLTEWGTVIGR